MSLEHKTKRKSKLHRKMPGTGTRGGSVPGSKPQHQHRFGLVLVPGLGEGREEARQRPPQDKHIQGLKSLR